jgi:hypothetical protein
MTFLPCRSLSGGCCRRVRRHLLTADRDKAGPTGPGLFVTWVLAASVVTAAI